MRFKGRIDLRAADFIVDKLDELMKPTTQADAKEIGDACLKEMKSLISKGISPIKGTGIPSRFPSYKNPDRYPGKRKSKSPVNLKLSGDMMNDLDYDVVKSASGYSAQLGYSSSKEQVKELGHREGANGQPIRPTVPQGNLGETFASSIQNVYLSLLNAVIDRVARRKQ